MDNVDNTFVTPVFNGSASLRDAAGQLIEETKKSARRGETIDDNYIQNLFSEVTALHRLDQIEVGNGKAELGPLPVASKILLWGLSVIWLMIIIYVVFNKNKSKRNGNTH